MLEDLNEAIEVRAVHLLGVETHQGMLAYSDGAAMDAHIDLEYIERFQFIDARVPNLLQPDFQGWMHCHEHFDEDFAASSPFWVLEIAGLGLVVTARAHDAAETLPAASYALTVKL